MSKKDGASTFDWTNKWYAVAWTSDVPLGVLYPFTLFDKAMVLYKDGETGIYVALDDVCPHRAAPLSQGRLYTPVGTSTTVLECMYHGWKFDTHGKCLDVPHAALGTKLPAATNVRRVYATSVSEFGLVFVWFGDRLLADDSKMPIPQDIGAAAAANDMQGGAANPIWIRPLRRRFPIQLSTIIENLVDPGHVAFAHHGTSEGDRSFIPRNVDYRVSWHSAEDGDFHSAITLLSDGDEHNAVRSREPFLDVKLLGGCLSTYSRTVNGRRRIDLLLYCTPSKKYETDVFMIRCRYCCTLFYRYLRPRVPLWVDHAQNNLTFDGDTPLIQWQEAAMRGKDWRKEYVMSRSTLDSLVAVYRKWDDVASKHMPFADGSDVPRVGRLRMEQINDRFEYHVRDCRACSAALRNLVAAKLAVAVCAVLAASVTVMATVLASVFDDPAVRTRLGATVAVGAVLALVCVLVLVGLLKAIRGLTFTDKAHRLHQLPTPDMPMSSDAL